MILVGILLLVAGWRVYEYVIIIAGAIIGASVGSSLVETNAVLVNVLALVIGGVIGALLSMFLYYIAVFLIGSHLGIVLTNGLASALSLQPVSSLALLVGAIIGGLILLGLSFEFLIVLSALVGGHILALGLGLSPVWTLLFALVGILIQYGLTRAYHTEFRRHRVYT